MIMLNSPPCLTDLEHAKTRAQSILKSGFKQVPMIGNIKDVKMKKVNMYMILFQMRIIHLVTIMYLVR